MSNHYGTAIKPLNRFPRMMQEYLTRRLRTSYARNHQQVMSLRTRTEVRSYQDSLREKLNQVFGDMPDRSPLNIRITGELKRGEYHLSKLLFDSRPGLSVAANLYRPQGVDGPLPAVLCLCGHSAMGKACESYQSFAQALARMGYITLIFDPLGQGERLIYPDNKGESQVGQSTFEHNFMARQQVLVGEWSSSWFAWDGIRALDVLLQQDGVDPSRVGVTGNSGGGNMTAYTVACDSRITMSAPSCWITSWHHNGINEEPIDAEQCPPGVIGLGLEQSDLLAVQAPKPTIIITQEQDFFDQRGSLEAFARLRHLYSILDAEDNLSYYAGPDGHGYWKEAREAMYNFFNRHAGVKAPEGEPEIVLEKPETLNCTDSGQVVGDGGRKVFAFTREKSEQLTRLRGQPSGPELKKRIRRFLNLPENTAPPKYRVLRPWDERHYVRPHASHYILESDPGNGAQVVVTKLEDTPRKARPLPGKGPALLYIPHLSSDKELRENSTVRTLQEEIDAFFACDYRGIGESLPVSCKPDSFHHLYGSDYHYASYAMMIGESYLAWRVSDITAVLNWMASFGYDQIQLAALGWGTIPAALTALLDDRIHRVTLINAPNSYREMAETELQQWPLSAMLPHVLEHFDLPDVYNELRAKNTKLITPVCAKTFPVPAETTV